MSNEKLSALVFYFKHPQPIDELYEGRDVDCEPDALDKLRTISNASEQEWNHFAKALEPLVEKCLADKLNDVGWKCLGSWYRGRHWERMRRIAKKGANKSPRDFGIGFCVVRDPELGSKKYLIATEMYFYMDVREEDEVVREINILHGFRERPVRGLSSLPVVREDWNPRIIVDFIDLLSLPGADSFSVAMSDATSAVMSSLNRISSEALRAFLKHADVSTGM